MAEKVVFQTSLLFDSPVKSAAGAVVTLFNHGSEEKATLYSDINGSNTVSNPSKVPSNGLFKTFVDPGRYDLYVTDGFQEIDLKGLVVGLDGESVGDVPTAGEVASGDFVVIYDSSAGQFKKLSVSGLQSLA